MSRPNLSRPRISRRHSSPAIGQRVWNTQPDGGLKGEGISPLSARGARARSIFGSGIGAASSSALV